MLTSHHSASLLSLLGVYSHARTFTSLNKSTENKKMTSIDCHVKPTAHGPNLMCFQLHIYTHGRMKVLHL